MVRRRQHRRRGCDGRNDRRCDVHDGDSDRIGRRAVAAVGNGQREHMSSRRQRDCRSDTRRGAKRSGPRVRQTIAVGIRGHAAVQRYVCETAGIGSHRPIRADVRNWRRIRRRELVRSHVDARIAVEVTVEDARVSVEIRRGELRRRIVPGIGRGGSGLQVVIARHVAERGLHKEWIDRDVAALAGLIRARSAVREAAGAEDAAGIHYR